MASHVVVTVPQPQVAGILGGAHPLVAKITDINMVPSLTLMAAVSGPVPPVCANGSGDLLALITRDCSNPTDRKMRAVMGRTRWDRIQHGTSGNGPDRYSITYGAFVV